MASLTGNQGDDPSDAHSYANQRVLAALRARLGAEDLLAVETQALKHAAAEALKADTARRR